MGQHYYLIMKYIFIVALFVGTLYSQDIMLNGNMESFSTCPTQTGQIQICTGFESAEQLDRADYYNRCAIAPNANADVPSNFNGYEDDPIGDGYIGLGVGVLAYSLSSELVSGELIMPIQVGDTVIVSMDVAWAENHGLRTDSICFFFSNTKFTQLNPFILPMEPHVCLSTINIDTTFGHTSTTFIADASGQYFVMGNFRDNSRINFSQNTSGPPVGDAYAYIDNISVESTNGPGVGIKPPRSTLKTTTTVYYDLFGRPTGYVPGKLLIRVTEGPAGVKYQKVIGQ